MRNLQLLLMSILLILVLFIGSCSNNSISNDVIVEEEDEEELFYLVYSPMQCITEPWNEWLEESDIRFIRAPTQEEIINMYYFEVYGITILNSEKITFDGAVCMACYTCPKGYSFKIGVVESDVNKLVDLGWKIIE